MVVGNKIRKLRKEKNWTQNQLGKKMAMNGRQIGKYETGDIEPSAVNLRKFAEVFNVSVDYLLFDGVEDMITSKVKDRELLKRFELIDKMDPKNKEMLVNIMDVFIRDSNIKEAYG